MRGPVTSLPCPPSRLSIFLNLVYSAGWIVIITVALVCLFLMTQRCHSLFHALIGYLNIFREMLIQVFCSFLFCFVLFLMTNLTTTNCPPWPSDRATKWSSAVFSCLLLPVALPAQLTPWPLLPGSRHVFVFRYSLILVEHSLRELPGKGYLRRNVSETWHVWIISGPYCL